MTLTGPETVVKKSDIKPLAWFIVILTVLTSGCAVSEKNSSSNNIAQTSEALADDDFNLIEEELAKQVVEIADPIEPFNRLMFHVNDALYFWVFKPCAQGCKAVIPEPARVGISNFFHNLTMPIRFVNCHLQWKTEAADMELNRFLINSTAGILGFGDPAKDRYGLEPPEDEDLGQSLAKYGIGNGFYIVWPLFGPSTARDSIGTVGGLFLNPVSYVEPTEAAISISAVKVTNENSFKLGEYEAFKSSSLDPYVAMREIYIQYRNKQIKE